MTTEKYFYLFLIAVLLFITGLLYKNDGNFTPQPYRISTVDLSGGDYFSFVFIGSSDCRFPNNDQVHEMVNYLKKNLEEVAESNSMNFILTGISVDSHSQLGLNYLNLTYPYDEIIVGLSIYSLGSVYYSSGAPTTPQILILYENYNSELVGVNINHLQNSQQVIKSFSGVPEIKQFYDIVQSSNKESIIQYLNL